MSTFAFTTTSNTFDLSIDGIAYGTWNRVAQIDSDYEFEITLGQTIIQLNSPYLSEIIKLSDTITVGGTPVTGTMVEKMVSLKSDVFYAASAGGGGGNLQDALDAQGATPLDKNNLIDTPLQFLIRNGIGDNYTLEGTQIRINNTDLGIYSQDVGDTNDGNFVVSPNLIRIEQSRYSDNTFTKLHITSTNATIQKNNGTAKEIATVNVADNFANDTAAATGGIPVGGCYHTGGIVKIRLT